MKPHQGWATLGCGKIDDQKQRWAARTQRGHTQTFEAVMQYEWLKILVSALAGMLAGLIGDPIHVAVMQKFEIHKMKCAIDLDLLDLIIYRAFFVEGSITPQQFWQREIFPSFNFYWERNREYFYSDPNLHKLRFHIQYILDFQKTAKSSQLEMEKEKEALDKIFDAIREIGTILRKQPSSKWSRIWPRFTAKSL
jgi:hypothetical protein